MKKLNDNQINELYNYANELIKDRDIKISEEEFSIYIQKQYKCLSDVEDEKLFDTIKESIAKVTKIFKENN
jgi:hypothetical protein